MNRSESKYFNTAVLMDKALISLLEKKDLQYITIKEICQAAGVNRSTFYLHYETIGDLLEETTDYIIAQFNDSFGDEQKRVSERIKTASLDELVLINNAYLIPYLNYVRENKSVFNAVFNNPKCLNAQLNFSMMKKHILIPILDRFNIPQNMQNYFITYYISGTVAIVREWLGGGCKETAEEIAQVIINCVRPSDFVEKIKSEQADENDS